AHHILDNCSCIVLIQSIHEHMLSPLIGTPHRYIPVGKAKRLPTNSQKIIQSTITIFFVCWVILEN
ncbi:MAG: hypothetical protein ACI9KM_001921, partial [Rubritalea sp.]